MTDEVRGNNRFLNTILHNAPAASRSRRRRGLVLATAMAMTVLAATDIAHGQAGTVTVVFAAGGLYFGAAPNAEIVFSLDCTGEGGQPPVTSVALRTDEGGIFLTPSSAEFEVTVPNTCDMRISFPTDPPAGYRWDQPEPYRFSVDQPGIFKMIYAVSLLSGGLQIDKTVSMPLPVDASFDFTVACTHSEKAVTPIAAANTSARITIPAGATAGSTTIAPIADGSTCMVTQAQPPSLPGYVWGPTSGPNADIGIAFQSVVVTEFADTLSAVDAIFADGFDDIAPTNPVQDGGFEVSFGGAGPWTSTSIVVDPLCDISWCGDSGAGPRTDSAWAWFVGPGVLEESTVSQSVTVPSGGPQYLNFRLWIGKVGGLDSELVVSVDGTEVASYPEPAEAEAGYTQRSVDIGAYADGEPHAIEFRYNGTYSYYNLDDVSIDSAPAPLHPPSAAAQRLVAMAPPGQLR